MSGVGVRICAVLLVFVPQLALGASLKVHAGHLEVGQKKPTTIVVPALAGEGPVSAAVNTGRIVAIKADAKGRVELRYLPPAVGSPQRLLLLLWRATGPAQVARLAIAAWTDVEVKARRGRNVEVRVKVGERVFGPVMSGKRRRVTLRVLVPVGVRSVVAEARSRQGMSTRREVSLPAVEEMGVVTGQRRSGTREKGTLRYEFFVAGLQGAEPSLMLRGPEGEGARDFQRPTRQGELSSATWTPGKSAAPGRWQLRVSAGAYTQEVTIDLPTLPAPPPKEDIVRAPRAAVKAAVAPPPSVPSRLRFNVGLTAGLVHNFEHLASPRFCVEVGLDYRLAFGLIGARAFGGVSWDSREILAEDFEASNSVLLLPLGLAVIYTTPSFAGVSAHVLAGGLVNVINNRTEGPLTGRVETTDVAFGVMALAGVGYRVGRGDLLLRAGYQYARVDSDDLEVLAGGLVVEGGYSLAF